MGLNKTHAGDEYFKWVMDLSDHLQTFATFTFSKTPSYEWAYDRGVKLWRLTNEHACGRHFREHHDGLMTVFAVEIERARPNIHMMQEAHPSLTAEVYAKLWAKAYGRWFSSKAIKIEPIRSKEAVARYIKKEVTWEQPPFIFIPKKYWDSG
ncbi:hypothetical protein KAX06_01250 [candidate division WOR-3 bacterium]|nr:hypothetical protein [candidate division WOR-3 bacterium]